MGICRDNWHKRRKTGWWWGAEAIPQEAKWYESHYALPLGRKKGAKLNPEEEEILNKKQSKKIQKKYDERKKNAKISSLLEEQFQQGKLLACIASRPGQCGRADGYVLEGKELEFYLRKIKARKGK
ncbi:40S ribosomal protein S8 [Sigmodon hispidus]